MAYFWIFTGAYFLGYLVGKWVGYEHALWDQTDQYNEIDDHLSIYQDNQKN